MKNYFGFSPRVYREICASKLLSVIRKFYYYDFAFLIRSQLVFSQRILGKPESSELRHSGNPEQLNHSNKHVNGKPMKHLYFTSIDGSSTSMFPVCINKTKAFWIYLDTDLYTLLNSYFSMVHTGKSERLQTHILHRHKIKVIFWATLQDIFVSTVRSTFK
jgi:hypothetical protein